MNEPTAPRVYLVEIVHRIYVTAESPQSARAWAESNVSEWGADKADSVYASELRAEPKPPASVLNSLPWCADGVSEEASEKDVAWWLASGPAVAK